MPMGELRPEGFQPDPNAGVASAEAMARILKGRQSAPDLSVSCVPGCLKPDDHHGIEEPVRPLTQDSQARPRLVEPPDFEGRQSKPSVNHVTQEVARASIEVRDSSFILRQGFIILTTVECNLT
jgi:hypothetical protein